ncbi:MAG TPA: hypothetical protein VH186_01200 [Chloroflexia bacterium]|nr:hypothetical protein [Chloroflexia bacterium]
MENLSTTGRPFLSEVEKALSQYKQLLILHRPSGAGGTRYWFLISKNSDISTVIATGKARSSFTVFDANLLALRGEVNAELKMKAVKLFKDCGELLMAEFIPDQIQLESAFGFDELAEVEDWLEARKEVEVVVGGYPNFDKEIVTGYTPDADGLVRPGAY